MERRHSSHCQLRSRVDETRELGLDGLRVRVQSWIVLELGSKNGMAIKQPIQEGVVRHAEHHAVADCNLIARDETSVVVFKLLLQVDKEGSPLGLDQLRELLIFLGRARH